MPIQLFPFPTGHEGQLSRRFLRVSARRGLPIDHAVRLVQLPQGIDIADEVVVVGQGACAFDLKILAGLLLLVLWAFHPGSPFEGGQHTPPVRDVY
jgi:hypothetical protein